MVKVNIAHCRGNYDIVIADGLLKALPTLLDNYSISGKLAIITDSTVYSLYGKGIASLLESSGKLVKLFTFPEGESSKKLETVSFLYDKLVESRYDRKDTIIALGGGVTGDIAGFTASTLYRGMKLVQIPTTLLSQVDSSVGGKTAVNHRKGKNLIGSFYPPELVLIDPAVLSTLHARDIISGLGEIIKYALIGDRKLFFHLEDNLDCLPAGNPVKTIEACCRIKKSFVEKDEFDNQSRMILNFGHTIGHALELVTDYKYYRHGEAVILGMMAGAFISFQKGLLSKEYFNRIEKLLAKISLPSLPQSEEVNSIFQAVLRDKKTRSGKISFVCLNNVGSAEIVHNLDRNILVKAIEYLLNRQS